MKDPASPNGRGSLAEALLKIARSANDLHLQARWLTSRLDLAPPQDERFAEALVDLAHASATVLDLAVGVNLGQIRFVEPGQFANGSEPDRPILAAIERKEALQLDPPAPHLTFEVLDGGAGQPGHIQFGAASIEEAMEHAAVNWPGLRISQVPWERNLDNPDRDKPKARRRAKATTKEGIEFRGFEPTTGSKALGPGVVVDWREMPTTTLDATLADMCFDAEIPTLGEGWGLIEAGKLPRLGWTPTEIEWLTDAILSIRVQAGEEVEWPPATPSVPGHVEVSKTDLDAADVPFEIDDDPTPPPADPLSTDEMLRMALLTREDMASRWETMRSQGATDLELRAAISRAFDNGLCDIAGFKRKGGFLILIDGRGECSYQAGDSPKFWAASSRWEGRPTLESRKLVERVRVVMQIPLEPGGVVPSATGRSRKANPGGAS